ncbi:hypothetical protein MA16_Dca025382 [Dendrobium catenatum]|uniref:Retrotransposon gag domain-containing protein n=1 Tax=Dendrobium catenatum TaxID=906689 RepID=A0A2I0VHH6_9ASPA|nr:hypothetical protein MA16_Dca025382 [Dendrobium catenatum]
MVHNSQFGGTLIKDLDQYLASFFFICAAFKYNGVTNDVIRLCLFLFSLSDKAKSWLNFLPSSSITTWNELAHKFLTKYFPQSKTTKLGNYITSFS